jgi:Fanconi anemia group M protein
MPHITVDHRESRSPVIQALKADPSLTIEVKELSCGDYLVREDTAIERKSATDFVLSIFDQRLFQQVARLKQEYARPIFVVEGRVQDAFADNPAGPSGRHLVSGSNRGCDAAHLR